MPERIAPVSDIQIKNARPKALANSVESAKKIKKYTFKRRFKNGFKS
jgi:hypothetical protein